MDAYVNAVQQGKGRPAILIHGLAASLHDWDALLPALADDGYRACALDLLGHGGSHKPERVEDYTIANVFRHLAGWVDSLQCRKPAVVIGHSLGGYLALEYALRFPERVRALVLVNPFYSTRQLSPFLQFVFRRPLMNTAIIERTPYRLFRLLIDVTSLRFGGGGDGIHSLPEAVRIQTALDYKRAAPGIYNIPRTLRDLTPDLPRIQSPALVVWGERDRTLAPATFPRRGGTAAGCPPPSHPDLRAHRPPVPCRILQPGGAGLPSDSLESIPKINGVIANKNAAHL